MYLALLKYLPTILAAALAVLGGWWMGHQGVHKERAVTAEHDRQCLADQRDVAQRAADAYSAELAAAADRALAAEAASREAIDRLENARRIVAPTIREVRYAQPVPVACVPDDLRLRVNAAVRAINAGEDPHAADPGGVPDPVPAAAGTGLRPPRLDG